MNTQQTSTMVEREIVLNTSQAHAFNTFTANFDAWWPKSHHIGSSEPFTAIIEPFVGGRWYERGEDGSECNWGRVLVWEPSSNLEMSWEINADWVADPSIQTEVAVQFIPEGENVTRVKVQHRNLESFGGRAEQMVAIFSSDNGWSGLLASLKGVAETSD